MSSADAFDRVVERERAHHRRRRSRRARAGLRIHARIYLVINVVFVATWLTERALAEPDHPAWWVPVTVGWGVGLALHAALVRRPWARRARRA